jgi:polyhydroxybutyrate depolymerase
MMNQQLYGVNMRVKKLGVVGSLYIALAAAACGNDSTPPPGTNPPPDGGGVDTGSSTTDDGAADAPTGDTRPCEGSTLMNGNFSLMHNGAQYGYLVHLPPSYDGTKRTPLLLNWHGFGSNAGEQQIFSLANVVADEQGFIVVYPNSPDRSWAAGSCCSMFLDGGGMPDRDDVGFARALVAEISKAACIDSKRVYSMGMSNGGFMSHRLACEAADLFAAVAPVAGKMGLANCQPSRPISVMHFHGTADMTVSYDTPNLSGEGVDVPEMMKRWGDRNGCTKGPDTTFQMGNVTCKTWSQCGGGVLVTLCTAEGDGHCWPGMAFCPGGTSTADISASRDGWAFLKQFVLP